MLKRLRPHLSVVITAAVVSAFFAGGPAIAKAAHDAVNADKVDGKHAVSATASIKSRAGKLVATAKNGRLPNNIIAKAPDANRLDGRKGTAYALTTNEGVAYSSKTAGGTLSSADLTVVSLTLKAPSNGYLMITFQSEFLARRTNAYVLATIVDGSSQVAYSDWDAGDVDDANWFDQHQLSSALVKVTKGVHTYHLTLSEQGGVGPFSSYTNAQLSGVFYHHGRTAPATKKVALANH